MSVHVERLDAHTRRVTSDTMILEVAGSRWCVEGEMSLRVRNVRGGGR